MNIFLCKIPFWDLFDLVAVDYQCGIDDALVVHGNEIKEIPKGYFAEEYIHGREFNISIIGGKKDYQVLLPAEMCFSNDYYETKPRILGYKACLLYTSDAADEEDSVDLGGRRI